MEELPHFSHEHPLVFFEDKEVDEDPKPYFCSICGLPILCSPSYSCSIDGCKFFLHKPCAQLPKKLRNPRYHPANIDKFPHTLYLKPNDESSHNFTYKCKTCKFDLHPLVAGAVHIKTKHKSHQSHPLVSMCRETLSLCDACGEKHNGFFFTCQECDFWIHPDCTLLSTYLNLKIDCHPHSPLILVYSLSQYQRDITKCVICKREVSMNIGFYYCGECDAYAHVSCAKSNVDNLKTETRVELIQLPDDDEGDTYPSLVIRRHIERHIDPIPDYNQLMAIDENYHKHPNLILHDDGGITSSSCSSREASNLVCDVCIQPILISSPFYTCQLQPNDDEYCHFLVHDMCADLLSRIDFSAPSKLKFLYGGVPCPDPSKYVFDSIFPCVFCYRPCNGFCCLMLKAPYFADLQCLVAPYTIKHASHGKHVLFYTTRGTDTSIPLTCCSYESLCLDIYTCFLCDFYIHVRCALLPKRTRHKFDEHPLELITQRYNHKECCFCEFCELDIEQQYWYYGCGKCEHYFHINCIPSVGYLSKVKFGGTHDDDKIHQHPLTLTRMLTHGRHERCGYCKEIIRGFVDEMAFRCSRCDFWIHFSCARDSSCEPELRVYWEVQEEVERKTREKLNPAV